MTNTGSGSQRDDEVQKMTQQMEEGDAGQAREAEDRHRRKPKASKREGNALELSMSRLQSHQGQHVEMCMPQELCTIA